MSRSIEIGGVERADLTRLESFSFQESAYRGEAGQGGFDVDSDGGAVTVPAWKDVVAVDSDGGQFFTGQTVDRGVGRGSYTTDADAAWDVQVIDINTIMDDILLRSSTWNRPEETDVERMQALVAYLNTQGYTIDDTYLLTTAPEDMDAQDYRKQGVYPRSVADECAENSGKNWYLFWDTDLDSIGIWYGRESSSLRTSAYSISSVLDDIDDYGVTWAAEWPEESGLQLDPSRVYSAVQVVYGEPPRGTYVDRPATETAFKRREAILYDASVKTEAKAEKLANHYLDFAESEDATITVSVTLPTTHVNAFQHGQRIAIRAPHLGYDTPTFMRCRQRTVEPAGGETKNPGLYHVTLVLKPSTKVTRFGGRPSNDVPGQGDNPSTGADVLVPIEVTGACATADSHLVQRTDNGLGTYTETLGGVGTGAIESIVAQNLPYTDSHFGCPIGGGSWLGYRDSDTWLQFTAPADSPTTYLGMQVEIDATSIDINGYTAGYDIRIASGAAAANRFGQGTTIASGPLSGTTTVYIPRSLITWGATNCLILHPAWLCERPVQFCNELADFSIPGQGADGRGNSGSYADIDVSTICAVRLATGLTGHATGVAGYGDVDGTNAEFTLLSWDGTGGVEVTINGLAIGAAEYVLDTGAKTATFNIPPVANSIVLFTYHVVT